MINTYKFKNIKLFQDLLKRFGNIFPDELVIDIDETNISIRSHLRKNLIKGFSQSTSDVFIDPMLFEDPIQLSIVSNNYVSSIISKYDKDCMLVVEMDKDSELVCWGVKNKKFKDIFNPLNDNIKSKLSIPRNIFNRVMNIEDTNCYGSLSKDDIKSLQSNFTANNKIEKDEFVVSASESNIMISINNCKLIIDNEALFNTGTNLSKLTFNGMYLKSLDKTDYKIYPFFDDNKIIFKDMNNNCYICFATFVN